MVEQLGVPLTSRLGPWRWPRDDGSSRIETAVDNLTDHATEKTSPRPISGTSQGAAILMFLEVRHLFLASHGRGECFRSPSLVADVLVMVFEILVSSQEPRRF